MGEHIGRPTKEQLVIDYLMEHPNDNISCIANALGVSRPTVYKYKKMIESEVQQVEYLSQSRRFKGVSEEAPKGFWTRFLKK